MTTRYLDDLVATVKQLPEDKIREVLDFAQFLLIKIGSSAKQEDGTVSWEHDPLWDIVGLGESGLADGSVEHDKYLYGEGHSCKTATYWQVREKDES